MFEGPGILHEARVGYELGQVSQVVIVYFWTVVLCSSDVLLRCMYGTFVETVCFRIFIFSNLGPALVLIRYVVVVVAVNIRLQ